MSCSATRFTVLEGMANPKPALDWEVEEIYVLMPMSSPLSLTRAPPELPGLIAASVWIISV